MHDKYRVFLLRFPIQHRDSGLPTTGDLLRSANDTNPTMVWCTNSEASFEADTRYNGAPAVVSSSIPNSERAREAERGGGGEKRSSRRSLRLLSTTTSDVSRGLDTANIRGGFFFLSSACKTDG